MNTGSNLGPLEQNIMNCLWRKEKASVRDVYSCLETSRKIAYTTVMTVMNRLVEKGLLTREKYGKAFIYSPRKTKEQTAKGMIKRIVDSFVQQYGHEAVTAFTDELKKHQ